jgi:hypothetical protein
LFQANPTSPAARVNEIDASDISLRADSNRQLASSGDRWFNTQRANRENTASLRGELTKKTVYLQMEYDRNDKLRQKNLRLQHELQELNAKHAELTAEKRHIKHRYGILVRELMRPYARGQNLQWNDHDTDSINRTLLPLIADVTEASQVKHQLLRSETDVYTLQDQLRASQIHTASLQTQVQSLQKQMLAQVDKVIAVPDHQFNQDFRTLAAMVKTLSRSIRVTEDMTMSDVLEPHVLHYNVAEHHWKSRARKKYYIEAWVWSVLYRKVFLNPFAIFGPTGKKFDVNWVTLFSDDFVDDWPFPSSVCEMWRYTSMEQLVDHVGRSTIKEGQAETPTESQIVETLRGHVTEARNATFNVISGTLAQVSPTADLSRVLLIINKAFSLAMEMSLQRSRLQVTWPYVGDQFVKEEMSCMPDSDGEEIEGGIVAFIVHPGLVKWGDANGKNFEERYDIVPSLVHLERPVGEPSEEE